MKPVSNDEHFSQFQDTTDEPHILVAIYGARRTKSSGKKELREHIAPGTENYGHEELREQSTPGTYSFLKIAPGRKSFGSTEL